MAFLVFQLLGTRITLRPYICGQIKKNSYKFDFCQAFSVQTNFNSVGWTYLAIISDFKNVFFLNLKFFILYFMEHYFDMNELFYLQDV